MQVSEHISQKYIVIDIRPTMSTPKKSIFSTSEQTHADVPVLHIPYYELQNHFTTLDAHYVYLLYCDSGMMSRIQAAHLRANGHRNVGVFNPSSSRTIFMQED